MSLIYPVGVIGGGGGVTPPAAFQVERSLRFNSADSAYLSRTHTTGNQQKWTLSCWIKRAALGARQGIFGQRTNAGPGFNIEFQSDDTIGIFSSGDSSQIYLTTTQVFRDPSAWMHLCLALDTTQGTAANRVQLSINGSQVTAFTNNTQPPLNYQSGVNRAFQHEFGYIATVGNHLSSYLAEAYFIDGAQKVPSDFGQTNSTTGQWEPIAYAGTYGANGFNLKFADNSNTTAATLGKDSSPNGNNWTPNNFSVAAGVGNDSLVDTPTNGGTAGANGGGEMTGNYCTINPLNKSASVVLSNGNLDLVATDGNFRNAQGTFGPSSGKWFFLCDVVSGGASTAFGIGLQDVTVADFNLAVGAQSLTMGIFYDGGNTFTQQNGGSAVNRSFSPVTGDAFVCAWDADTKQVWLGTWHSGAITWAGGGNPATGTTPTFTYGAGTTVAPYVSTYSTTQRIAMNFGQRAFTVAAPTGFKALCTANLPEPAIVKPSQFFGINTWTGTAGARTLVNDGVFQPDLLWAKSRSSAISHGLTDAVRGVTKILESNSNAFDRTLSDEVLSFNSTGFSLGGSANGYTNANGPTYVGWQWKQGITPGLFIGAFATTSGTQAVPHGLGVAPKFVLVKNRTGSTAGNWHVWHSALANPSTSYLLLNSTSAALTFSTMWGPSGHDSVNLNFSVSGSIFPSDTNVAYAFAEVPGFSRFGSYVGNGAADGSFVWCGFRPRWIMIKPIGATGSWLTKDTGRNPYNSADANLYANLNIVEDVAPAANIDILSNGFKLRGTYAEINASGGSYLFAAFAESPFKYARAEKSPTPGVVSNPAATSFQVTAPANAANGVPFNFTVQAQAAGTNTTNYTGTIHFTSTAGGATLPADSTLVSGVKTFSATFPSAGTFTITATDTVTGTIVGTSGNITSAAVTPGSQTFTAVGANSFTVPAFNTLSIECFGAGGGGGGAGGAAAAGGAGGASTFVIGSLSAGGGTGGGGTAGAASSGGVASGGDTNTNGSAGNGNPSNTGGAAANGGPGTGGNSAATGGGFGGGGGSYVKKTYTPATLTIGSNISIAVGGGGGGGAGSFAGTAGGNGKAVITWS